MRILLSNDDGVFAPGIRALAEELKKDNEVYICAPDSERSGAGHSFTYLTPLWAKKVSLPGLEEVPAYAISGTPADCVKLGCGNLVPSPDIVISGINMGANLGTDAFYSGTVAAAMEAALNGVRAIAVSNVAFNPKDFGACLAAMRRGLELMQKDGAIKLLNINAPDGAKLKGFRLTGMARRQYKPEYEERTDPYGRKYYWASTELMDCSGDDCDSDYRWTGEGYASITPMLMDLTDKAELERLKRLAEAE